MLGNTAYPRGSEWRLWDLHIHTPASFHWEGVRFVPGNDVQNNGIIDDLIVGLNEAEPQVFAFMDYFTFEGWFALKRRLQDPTAPKLEKTVFPGIELRLSAPMRGRLNAHVVFSDKIQDQHLRDFLSAQKLELIDRPLSDAALADYARRASAEKLAHHGFKKADVEDDETIALQAGHTIGEINCDAYKEAIRRVPNGMAVGFMPFSTNDGLTEIERNEHYAYSLSLFETSPIFETRDHNLWAAFAGVETPGNKKWLAAFQTALGNVPRLAVSGSDSHRFRGVAGDNNHRGYGDFPSNKKTWIKADPTWEGLLQAIREPAKRSFLGAMPPKLELVNSLKTFYIDKIAIKKVATSTFADDWLDGVEVNLNHDLVAIIGNKGSGKSALADVIALLGNSQQQKHFSFLQAKRFRGKNGEPAHHFEGTLNWLAGEPGSMVLSDNPSAERVELVKYIPQGRFEALCNEHVMGTSNAFENELRSVIFTHVPTEVADGALDFDQLIEKQEEVHRAKVGELRKRLRTLNEEIVHIEDQLNPALKSNLEEQLSLKRQQVAEHKAAVPKEVPAPTDELSAEQQDATLQLVALSEEMTQLAEALEKTKEQQVLVASKRRSIKNINARVAIFESQLGELRSGISADLTNIGLQIADVVQYKSDVAKLADLESAFADENAKLIERAAQFEQRKEVIQKARLALASTLNEPQQMHQDYLAAMERWQKTLATLEGTETSAESVRGLTARLSQLQVLPDALGKKREDRRELAGEIYDLLAAQREGRAELFSPLQSLIQGNTLIREGYKLEFVAKLGASVEAIASRLFNLIKQNAGELRGEEESLAAVRSRFEKHDFTARDHATQFVDDMDALVRDASNRISGGGEGIRTVLRKDREPVEVYDFIFGLEYLEPKYTLLFQDTQIEQLSPGQRGALLLIFYLLVDKGRNPIVLDQPEENLDNETVVSLLVPVLEQAKQNRQIIMVTHNPNLAVVCDAEQIIFAEFDRKENPKIIYVSGAIEAPLINKHVVTVLEGTKPAFNNRSQKYH
ncbi:ABC transporter [Aminobacter sp. DSM 101952]|uniref:TrlF family AAA-like ATPase n=1 Tax=Aminobacter sp. DSM 101952 TaxID=2735891 RepID=UPI0006F39AE7|nr:AAA family ATPase [Aminobacter sp. DSM 101952]KQU72431.1 ABC transporter [Aminobacter sp. DSM 101952]